MLFLVVRGKSFKDAEWMVKKSSPHQGDHWPDSRWSAAQPQPNEEEQGNHEDSDSSNDSDDDIDMDSDRSDVDEE